ncbi:MAG TPA: sigma-70 family RNA polymerase sigma factor [Dehalococcoidia bacterium]
MQTHGSEARVGQPEHGRSATEEATLVAAAQADPRAFLPLYACYYRPLYRFCYIRLGTVQAAEDATHDVFVQALRGLASYRGEGFAAWLFRIAQNIVTGVQRWRQRHPSEPLTHAELLRDEARTPEERTLHRADIEAVRASLATLSEAQRLAIELALAGLADAQIAEQLDRTPDAVKMLRYRGMQRMKRLWRDYAAQDTEPRDG